MSALEIIALDEATPQLRAPGAGDTYLAPRALAITPVSLTGAAATSSLSITQTWDTTGTPTAFDVNVTDTASNATSALAKFRVGGADRITLFKSGAIGLNNLTSLGAASISGINWSLFYNGPAPSGYALAISTTGRLSVGVGGRIEWGSYAGSPTVELALERDAANTLALRNGVNAQAFHVYNTYTDASNYERGFIRYSSNVLQIGHEFAGTGATRNVALRYGGQDRLILNGNGIEFAPAGATRAIFSSSGALVTRSIVALSADQIGFSSSTTTGVNNTNDTAIARSAAAVLSVTNGSTGGGAMQMTEMTAPAAPAADSVRIYAEDAGGGKTRLMALFATGAAQQIAIEP